MLALAALKALREESKLLLAQLQTLLSQSSFGVGGPARGKISIIRNLIDNLGECHFKAPSYRLSNKSFISDATSINGCCNDFFHQNAG